MNTSNPRPMQTETETTTRTDRRARAAQAGVAALVAASLLAFSLIAFRTGLMSDVGPGVRAERPSATANRPVVLPATPRPAGPEQTSSDEAAAAVAVAADVTETATASDDPAAVLGIRETNVALADAAPTVDLVPMRRGATMKADWSGKGAERKLATTKSAKDEQRSKGKKPAKDKQRPKAKQTGHDKARGRGHHKNDHNGAHAHATSPRKSQGHANESRGHRASASKNHSTPRRSQGHARSKSSGKTPPKSGGKKSGGKKGR